MTPRAPGNRAFIQLELLLAGLLGCLLLGVFLAGLLTLLRSLVPARVQLEGRVHAVAPCYAPFSTALQVQKHLLTWLTQASAVYVLGASELDDSPSSQVIGPGSLVSAELPSLCLPPGALPLSAESLVQRHGSSLGSLQTSPEAGCFSLLVFAPESSELSCACLVQVRRTRSADKRWDAYSVLYRDRAGLRLDYAFVEPSSGSSRLQAAALRSWHRKPSASHGGEEAALTVVLPDPWRFAGDLSAEIGGLSRFAQVLTHAP